MSKRLIAFLLLFAAWDMAFDRSPPGCSSCHVLREYQHGGGSRSACPQPARTTRAANATEAANASRPGSITLPDGLGVSSPFDVRQLLSDR